MYGGFSLRCEDFCSDVWRFRIGDCKWQPDDPTACKWQELNVLGRSGPGRRWKAASVRDGGVFYMYGGHRMWHGFGETNSVENKWADTFQYAFGGYMDDLWRYTYGTYALRRAGSTALHTLPWTWLVFRRAVAWWRGLTPVPCTGAIADSRQLVV